MPELPEVETIRRGLLRKVKGKAIKKVDIKVAKIFIGDKSKIINGRIKSVKRVAKILQIDLDNNYSIIIHLKMTGQLVFEKKGVKLVGRHPQKICFAGGHPQKIYEQPLPHKHTHVIYEFDDGSHLYFNDLRKFGWNKVVNTELVKKIFNSNKFGPEPGTKKFTVEYLKNIFSRSRKPIKAVLMDQEKISGIGNIYSSESLYYAGINPAKSANKLTKEEVKKLRKAIEKVITSGIKYGGASENTYVNVDRKKGKYMDIAVVYQKKKDPKGHKVTRIKLGGRGTFYCKICQK